ncbi:MAG: RraA family protein [Rhodobacter sp.]|nr:RraA family protein [Paracoccaceae bacterium]MCC0077086.1 RraA family protein [Rhodobacter sp.]
MSTLIERLARLDSCAVSDAKDSLGLSAAVSGLGRKSGQGVLAGRVKTVQLAAGKPPADAPKVHLGARAIVAADAETVIVVAHPGIDAGGWGGVLSTGAQIAGVRGVVVDGPIRDADEAAGLGFAIFSRTTTARTARGRVYEVSTGAPVSIGGEAVADGDYVIADGSGVVFIRAADIEPVLAAAEKIAAREAAMVAALRQGRPITEVMGANYETMLEVKS